MKAVTAVLIATTVGAVGALVSGAEFLEVLLPGGLPIGNAVAAVAMCAAPASAFALSQPHTRLRRVAAATVVAAGAWLPVSVILAGNLTLNFSGVAGTVWLALTVVTSSAALGTFAAGLLLCLLGRGRTFRRAPAAAEQRTPGGAPR